MDQNALYYLIATAMIVIGLIGTVLPALPGLPLVFGGMLVAAWTGDFQHVGIPMLVVLGILTLVSLGIDLWATALGAKRVGASRKAIIGAVLGTSGPVLRPAWSGLGPFAARWRVKCCIGEPGRATLGEPAKIGFGTWMGILSEWCSNSGWHSPCWGCSRWHGGL